MMSSDTAVVTLPGETQILITREFDAPPDLVWRAWTTPQLIRRWWAGRRGTVTLAEVDLRVGGGWLYVMEAHGGFEVGFHGEYLEIEPHRHLVNTEVFEGMPDAQALNTIAFIDLGSRTRMELLVDHTCREHRDAHVGSGMETGMQEAMDALEEVSVGLAAA